MAALADRAATASAIRTLLAGAIDYAGLFPPAALPMREAVRLYASYCAGSASWALGRFVVPLGRLAEFQDEASRLPPLPQPPWRLAAVAGAGGADDWVAASGDDWVAASGIDDRRAVVDSLELRAHTADEVHATSARLPVGLRVFYEIPLDGDPTPLIGAIARVGGKAKARTGGVTADAFPLAEELARFIVACARAAVPFKATAGLHHPLRARYRLTYAADSPRGEMFGFLNVLLGAAFAREGLGADDVVNVLTERNAAAFRFAPDGVEWRGQRIDAATLADVRSRLAMSFGSCSFTEPIEELEALGLL